MKRCALLSLLLVTSCASQPICKPWSPEVAAPAAEAPAPAAAAPAVVDDGTVVVASVGADDAWTSVVGERSRGGEASEGAPRRRPRVVGATPAASRTSAKGEAAPAAPPPAAAAPASSPPAPAAVASSAAPPSSAAKTAKAGPNPKLAEARSFFAGRCVPCHGASGRGDGPAGNALNPHPRNFTDRAWQQSVTDAHIEKVITQGGPSVGKSPLMPAHADLKDPVLLSAVREVVRGFGR